MIKNDDNDDVICDQCLKEIGDETKAIKTVRPDLDLHGIWMGDLQVYIWMKEETFCSFDCFIQWLQIKRALAKITALHLDER